LFFSQNRAKWRKVGIGENAVPVLLANVNNKKIRFEIIQLLEDIRAKVLQEDTEYKCRWENETDAIEW
jgi:hypothetical protein